MSISISNGYIIEKEMNVYDLIDLVTEISVDITRIKEDIFYKNLASLYSIFLDYCVIYNREVAIKKLCSKYDYSIKNKEFNLNDFIKEIIIRDSKSNLINHSDFDLKCVMKILPVNDGKFLFLLISEYQNEYGKIFGFIDNNENEICSDKYKYIKPYIYYNNTDKPANLSEEEWEIRRKLWNKFLNSGYSSNYDLGHISNIETNFRLEHINKNKLLDIINNNRDKRIENLTKSYMNRLFESKVMPDMSISDYLEEYEAYINSNKYKENFNKYKKEFDKKLKRKYTSKDIVLI